MAEQEFREKYNALLKEFQRKYNASGRLHKQLHEEDLVKSLKAAKSNDERTAIIAAKIFKIEADRTDQLVGFMLKRFLDIHD